MTTPGRLLLTLTLFACATPLAGAAVKADEPTASVEALFKALRPPANRLRLIEATLVPGQAKPVVKAAIEFTYLDPSGKEMKARAKLYLPEAALQPKAKLPLFFAAGYELDDGGAPRYIRRGFAVVTPGAVNPNPLIRSPNPDIALLHAARALPFVDDARVVIGGGSAGGWMTLLLAAETFPLAGAAADLPPVNWGYNGAYFFKQKAIVATLPKGEKTPKVPVLFAVSTLLADAGKVYGDDYGDATWYAHSPVSHVPTITCPVLGFWSTADVLVPIDQVAATYVRPFDKKAFPEGFTMDPEKLTTTKQGRLRLLDVLAEKDHELFVLKEDAIKKLVAKQSELPFSREKQWSVVILDEGKPEPQVGHVKYAVGWSRDEFLAHVTKGQIAAAQLTAAKLERLMDRYAGKEWLPTKLKHLDVAEVERADVIRGLKTYVAAGAEQAKTFANLYGKLPTARQVLDPEALKAIQEGK